MTTIVQDHVNILGTQYSISIKTEEQDSALKDLYAYVYYSAKQIVLRNLIEQYTADPVKFTILKMRESLRHEIIHAFLYESGLHDNSIKISDGWATNEEMVDWLAIQSPKIYKAMKEAKCL